MGVDFGTLLEDKTETVTSEPEHAHIVDRGDDPRPAWFLVIEARVNGTPVTALCGHTWVPSRNPENLPVCQKCVEIFEFAKDFRGV